MDLLQLRTLLQDLETRSVTDGSSCVTLLIPRDYDNGKLSIFLTTEAASGENVKNKTNRLSIGAAFRQIKA